MPTAPTARVFVLIVIAVGCLACSHSYRPWWFSERGSQFTSIEGWDISVGLVCPQTRGHTLYGELMLDCQFAFYAARRSQKGDEALEIDSILAYDPNSVGDEFGPCRTAAYTRLAHRVPWQTSVCIPGEYRMTVRPPLCSHNCRFGCAFEVREGDRVHARVFCRLVKRANGKPDLPLVIDAPVRAPASWRFYLYGPPPTS